MLITILEKIYNLLLSNKIPEKIYLNIYHYRLLEKELETKNISHIDCYELYVVKTDDVYVK